MPKAAYKSMDMYRMCFHDISYYYYKTSIISKLTWFTHLVGPLLTCCIREGKESKYSTALRADRRQTDPTACLLCFEYHLLKSLLPGCHQSQQQRKNERTTLRVEERLSAFFSRAITGRVCFLSFNIGRL